MQLHTLFLEAHTSKNDQLHFALCNFVTLRQISLDGSGINTISGAADGLLDVIGT